MYESHILFGYPGNEIYIAPAILRSKKVYIWWKLQRLKKKENLANCFCTVTTNQVCSFPAAVDFFSCQSRIIRIRWQGLLIFQCPTELLPISKLPSPWIDVFEVNKIKRSTDFSASKLWMCRSGNCVFVRAHPRRKRAAYDPKDSERHKLAVASEFDKKNRLIADSNIWSRKFEFTISSYS